MQDDIPLHPLRYGNIFHLCEVPSHSWLADFPDTGPRNRTLGFWIQVYNRWQDRLASWEVWDVCRWDYCFGFPSDVRFSGELESWCYLGAVHSVRIACI